jgi:hypothetical protein
MSATATEVPDRVDVEAHARTVSALLREYAAKLATLCDELLAVLAAPPRDTLDRAAWLLDRSDLVRKPLLVILSRGSGLRENGPLEPLTRDELSLRMFEAEVHIHHALRLTGQLRDKIAGSKYAGEVKKLRLAAGLSAMKGGPLDPD